MRATMLTPSETDGVSGWPRLATSSTARATCGKAGTPRAPPSQHRGALRGAEAVAKTTTTQTHARGTGEVGAATTSANKCGTHRGGPRMRATMLTPSETDGVSGWPRLATSSTARATCGKAGTPPAPPGRFVLGCCFRTQQIKMRCKDGWQHEYLRARREQAARHPCEYTVDCGCHCQYNMILYSTDKQWHGRASP
jgi:hypothetical protein